MQSFNYTNVQFGGILNRKLVCHDIYVEMDGSKGIELQNHDYSEIISYGQNRQP